MKRWLLVISLLLSSTQWVFAADATTATSRSTRWMVEGGSLIAYVGDQWAEYKHTPSVAGQYVLRVIARQKDGGGLTFAPGYAFSLDITINGTKVGTLSIPAAMSATVVDFPITLPATESSLRLAWTNDAYVAGVSDPNLQLDQVSVVSLAAPPPVPEPPEPGPFEPEDLDQNGHVGLLDLKILVDKLLELYCTHADAPGC
jgi:hypothetical protein